MSNDGNALNSASVPVWPVMGWGKGLEKQKGQGKKTWRGKGRD